MQNSRRLFEIADQAKFLGEGYDYDLANIIFAHILHHHLERGDISHMSLLWETADREGEIIGEAYYDLITLSSTGDVPDLCIPLPLLSSGAIACIARRGFKLMEKKDHCREFPEEVCESDLDQLWFEFFEEGFTDYDDSREVLIACMDRDAVKRLEDVLAEKLRLFLEAKELV